MVFDVIWEKRGSAQMTAIDTVIPRRDYSLTGASAAQAVEQGLTAAEWYHADVPRKVMKDLMQRTDGPAIRDTVIWIGLLLATGAAGIATWGTWWAVPAFFAYGVLYGSVCDSRWHEAGHGTAFRTQWMNDWVYHLASFMVMRNPVSWRWSHARHHTHTYIVGRDPEIAFQRPASVLISALKFVGVVDAWLSLKVIFRNAFGIFGADERDYIPPSELPKARLAAQVHVAIYAATIVTALAMWSWLPLMLIGLPRLYGTWHMNMTGLIQHGGLAENVIDHRLNSRTCYMNPVSRWIYWNMNYHVEHHMFPMVPYHALPRLHELIKHDMPPATPSIWAAFREMTPAILRQRHDPGYYLRKDLPPTARPYREDLHQHIPQRAAE
jgi:fatty acid desaturase